MAGASGGNTNPFHNDAMNVLESLGAMSMSSAGTSRETKQELQEKKRQMLETKMAGMLRQNSQIDQELQALGISDREDDTALLDLRNIFGSTAPELLSADYTTRLQILDNLNVNLEEQMVRKSGRIQGLQAERVNKSKLQPRERSNLE